MVRLRTGHPNALSPKIRLLSLQAKNMPSQPVKNRFLIWDESPNELPAALVTEVVLERAAVFRTPGSKTIEGCRDTGGPRGRSPPYRQRRCSKTPAMPGLQREILPSGLGMMTSSRVHVQFDIVNDDTTDAVAHRTSRDLLEFPIRSFIRHVSNRTALRALIDYSAHPQALK